VTDRQEVWIVDRFEGDYAVVERALHETLHVPRALLPAGVREGDALRVTVSAGGEEVRLAIARDAKETRRRATEARRILGELKQRDPGGTIKP
jgi:hypothetical protein